MGISGPKIPAVDMPPPAAHPSTVGSASIGAIAAATKQRAAAAEGAGHDNTIKTSPEGTDKPNTAKVTLLGQ